MKTITLILTTLLMTSCNINCNTNTEGTSSFTPMAVTGHETWTIDGKAWQIESTYYLALPEGLQFTIETPVENVPDLEATALQEVWPLIRYTCLQQTYLRTKIHAFNVKNDASVNRIGVSLFRREGIKKHGIRIAMSLAEIQNRLEAEKIKN